MKTDRRTKYTKNVLKEALLELIRQKPFQKITVSDICTLADVSRPTFYTHYSDVYSLLDDIGQDILNSGNLETISRLDPDDSDAIFHAILNLVEIIRENINVYRICVLERRVDNCLPAQITDRLKATIIHRWESENRLHRNFPGDYLTEFIQSSFNGLIYCWISKPEEERESPQILARMIETLLMHGLCACVSQY